MLTTRSDGRSSRCYLPAALFYLLLLQHQQVPGTNARPANEDDLESLHNIIDMISMRNLRIYMTTLFPLDYKTETDMLPDIEDEICATGMSFHLLKNNLKHLHGNLHEKHPVQKYINDIVDEMSIFDKLIDTEITNSYSKMKISPLELINKLQYVSEYLEKYQTDLTKFQNHLKSCVFRRPTEKPTVTGNQYISSPASTYSDQILPNTTTHLDTHHETAALRGLDESVTIGTFDHSHLSATYDPLGSVHEVTESSLNSTTTPSETEQSLPIITSRAASHRETATPSVETNSTDSDASDLTAFSSLVTRVASSTGKSQVNLVSTIESGYADPNETVTVGTTVAPSKVMSDSYLLPSTSMGKQVNPTSAPRSKVLPHLIGTFSAASQHDNGSLARTESQQIQSSARPSKNILSQATVTTSPTNRSMVTGHSTKRPDALPTLANGSKLPSSSESHRPAEHQIGTEVSWNDGNHRRLLQAKLLNTDLNEESKGVNKHASFSIAEEPPNEPLKPADQRHPCCTSAAIRSVHTNKIFTRLHLLMGILWSVCKMY